MLDTDLPVPSKPERPIPLIAGIEDIERSVCSNGSGHLSPPRGCQAYMFEMDRHLICEQGGGGRGRGRGRRRKNPSF